jgi:uncharacterized protein (DUF1330 family)
VRDPEALKAYSVLAAPVIAKMGGRFLVRGVAAQVHEAGLKERTVVVEFDSLEQAVATHNSAAYGEALAALGDAAERDFRIVEGAA